MKNKLMAKHCEKREENREREKGEGEREEKTQAPVKIYIVYILYINNIIFNPMSREIVIYD